ncbi:MAG: restriction endonuclease subunit S [Bacteroidales bacterium]|nr:restriction endonuclease subunit S [Bacteroidales bacterium]
MEDKNIKKGWEIKKLGEVCESDLGKTLNQAKDTGNLYPYLCAINVLWDKFDFSTVKYTRFEKSELERYSVRKGDLLICEGGDIGRSAIWDKEESMQYQNALHRVRFNGSIEPRFCLLYFRFLKNSGILDLQYGKGVTIKHLVKTSLLSIPIPIPPLSEQERIVGELDCLSGVIEKKKEQLKELDALAQSIFYEMFGNPVENDRGWEVKRLGEITSKIGSGATPKGGNESYKLEGISLIRSLNVHNNLFVYKDLAHIDIEQADSLKNVIIEKGDVLLNITGASVARCCIVPDNVLPARVNQHVAIIRMKDIVSNIFICHQLISDVYQKELLSIGKSNGATREALTKVQLEKLNVIIPPLSLQQEFAEKIESIEKQKELIRKSIEEVEMLFNSRMEYYFG